MKGIFFLILFIGFGLNIFAQEDKEYKKSLDLMGSVFEINIISNHPDTADFHINLAVKEIVRIEALISSWNKYSQTSQINRNAGIRAVKVDKELINLIERSKKISELTRGIFDISYASLDKIWRFDGTMTKMPTDQEIEKSVEKINFRNIIIDKDGGTVFLKEKGMKIGFGAIGKGYAADMAKKILKKNGVNSGIVNAGGDLTVWGKRANGENWKIGITDPNNKNKIISYLDITENSIVTSGNYQKFVHLNGKKYTHIINPKTGMPTFGLKSVTIICPNTELADALATSVFIMGVKKGLDFINQLKGIECLLVDDKNQFHKSNNMKLELKY